MKKMILLLLCLWLGIGLQAQTLTISGDGKTASIDGSTAGCLVGTTVLSAAQKLSVTSLTITSGTIDATDFQIMKVTMAALTDIDLSGTSISAYTGAAGTNGASQAYPANTVPARAFYYISRVKTFKTPSTATAFGSQAFLSTTSMISISVPSSVNSIGSQVFYNCSAIVTVDPANTIFASDAYGIVYGLTGGVKTSIYSAPTSTTLSAIDYTVPTGVTSIAYQAFEMNNFHSITLSSSVSTIGTYAFEACNAATIYIPSSVTSIGTAAFLNSPSIVTVDPANTKFASDVTYGIVYGLTTGKTSIIGASTSTSFNTADYTIPSTITSIPASIFYKNNLHSLTTTSVTTIGANAFDSNNIPTVNITSPVTSFGNSAFNLANTTTLNLTGVINISGTYVFQGSKITTLTLSNSLTNIGSNAFGTIPSLTSVNIPASVTTIGAVPFYNSVCAINVDAANPNYSSDASGALYDKNKTNLIAVPTSLTGSYVIPSTVTTISAYAFFASKLTSITIPSAVTSIGANAFQNVNTVYMQIHAQGSTPSAITLGTTVFTGLNTGRVNIWVADAAAVTAYKTAAQWLAYPVVRELPASVAVSTAGSLSTLMSTAEQGAWTGLKLTGALNAVDFKYINGMAKLTTLDLSGVTSIEAYTGTAGPVATSTVYPANEIPQYSFNGKTLLTSVVLPDGITSMGQFSFKGCTALTSITIPDAVSTIGANTFENCTTLATVHLPASLTTIPYFGFSGCSQLATINIPSQITLVDTQGFYNCAKLTSVTLPSTITKIGGYAFAGCTLLSTASLPTGLTTIDQRAFLSCSSLTTINIPSTVATIGTAAFYACSSLTAIDLPATITSLDQTFGNCTSLTAFTLPDAIQTLNANLFLNCTALKNVALPTQLKTFNSSAFAGCTILDSVSISTSNIYYSSVSGALFNLPKTILVFCPTGKKGTFTIPSPVKVIAANAFTGCSGLTAIDFGTSTPTTFEGYAFSYCTGLTTITIPSSVTSMQNYAGGGVFLGCTNLVINYAPGASYVVVDGVTFTADMQTLVSCPTTKTGNYVIPDGVTKIDDGAFASSSLTSVIMPSSVTSMGSWAFLGASQLTSVTLSSSLTKLPWQCFFACAQLKSVVIPSGVTVLEQGVFYNDYQLRSVTLPEGLTRIGNYAFQSCPITSIVLPKSLKSVGFGAFGEDFLLSIEFPAGFERFDGDGVFWNQVRTLKLNNPEPIDLTMALAFATTTVKNNAALIVPAGSKTKYANAPGWREFKNIIEDGSAVDLTVTSTAGGLSAAIRTLGFSILNVKKLTVDGHINAFDIKMMRDSMLLLSDIDMSAAIIDAITTATTLGTSTANITYAANTFPTNGFLNCKRIVNSFILPNTLTTIDAAAFQYARGIKSVYIPASVTTLGGPLTYDNFILYTVDPASTSFMSDGVAVYNKSQTNLYLVSNAATGSYAIAPTTTTIQGYAFYGAQLTSVVLPAGLTATGYYIFSGNTALSYISYSKTPTALQGTTFYSVNGASKLYVPAGTKPLYLAQTSWSGYFGASRIIEMASAEKAITAGGLASALTPEEKAGLIKLKLTGEMDARDFKFIRDSLTTLTSIDLTGVTIAALANSTEGTGGNASISYPANVVPMSAFLNKNIVDSIALPTMLDSISINAFRGCSRLADMPIPTSVTAIASNGLAGCDKLAAISIPNVTTLGENAFTGCTSLKSVTMPALTTMGKGVFVGCTSLTNAAISNSIALLPASTFANCSSLSSVSIPGVSAISAEAFLGCIKLTSMDLGSITSLGRAAFSGCTGLKSVTLPNVTVIADNTFAACSGLTSLVIPSSVTTLSAYSFLNCTGLTSVTIPKEVTYIAPTAFEGCTGLIFTMEAGGNYFIDTDGVIYTSAAKTCLVSCPTSKAGSFVIPSTVTEIKSGAFQGCLNLSSITLPTALTALPDSVFLDCNALISINFNEGLTSIGKWAFGNCVKLVSVNLPSTLTSIGASAFENCNKLENINIPIGVTVLSDRLLANCFRLINFKIPENVTTIGTEVFTSFYPGGGANLGNLVLPVTTTSIAANAFKNAIITTITALNPVPAVFAQSNVFFSISTTTPLYVPTGTVAAYRAAAQWANFTFIMEPSELAIAVTAGNLTNLLTAEQKIQVKKLTLTGTMDARDFQTIKSELIGILDLDLSAVSILAYTGTLGTGGTSNIAYSADEIPTSAMGPKYKTVLLPTTTKSIGSNAFNGCSLIDSISLPASVTNLAAGAFQSCIRLANINVPAAVTSIGDGAFYGCNTLPSITIPEGTTSIGAQTFYGCINLTSVGLPSTVTSIGSKAFMSCEKLKTILIYANVNTIGGYAFANCAGLDTVYTKPATPIALGLNTGATPYVFYGKKSTCTLRVPEDSKVAYVAADQWKEFGADNTIEEAWFGKKVIFSFNGVAPTVKRGDGKTIISGTKVVEGTILTFSENHPANYVQTLKSTPIGKSVYTYYAPTTQTATSGLTDIPVTDNLVFTLTIDPAAVWNGTNDNSWSTPDNWSSHYVPTEFDDVVINLGANTTVAGDNSTCHNLTINSGSVHVPAGKMLTVNGSITNNTDVNGLVVKADENGVLPNGTLIFQNAPASTFVAAVEMYSKSTTDLSSAQGSKYNWQHFGIPVRNYDMSNPGLDGVFVREYNESGTTQAKQWSMKSYEDVLSSFKGYEIAPNANQTGGIKHNFTGTLENRSYQSGLLGYTSGALNQGYNLLANPYTAAINMASINYGVDMMQTVYLYSSGSLNEWNNWNSAEPRDTTNANTGGQYVAVPKLLAGVGGLPATIPSMQAFVVRAIGNVSDSIGIPYVASAVKNTELQRVRRIQAEPSVSTKILVTGASKKADCMWIFSNANCTRGFDNGYDGEKMLGSSLSPQIYAAEVTGDYQVNSVNDINNTEIGFKAGNDTSYTLTFIHSNLNSRYATLYLVDLKNNVTTDITASGTHYVFTASSQSVAKRFKIMTSTDISNAVTTPSDAKQLRVFSSGNLIFVHNLSDENGSVELYNIAGQYIQKLPFDANGITTLATKLAPGSYVVKAITTKSNQQVVERVIIKN